MLTRVVDVIIRLIRDLSEYQYNLNDIDLVAEKLSTLGYTNEEISVALVWLLEGPDNQEDTLKTINKHIPIKRAKTFRILHESEQMVINPQAYGYIIQLRELGLLNDKQTETIIERAILYDTPQMTVDDIKFVIATVLLDPDDIGWQKHSLLMSSLMMENETVQ